MSDESMRKKRDDGPGIAVSRRWFLQGAVAAVGVTGFALGQGKTKFPNDKPVIPDGLATADCECVSEAALPLMAAAKLGEAYFGFAGTEIGPRIFSLNVDSGRKVSLGSPVKLGLPEGFVFGSMGVARGGLVVTGGLPFVLETIEVDYELTEDVRAAMDNSVPEGIPTSGRDRVEIMGVRPAVFMVNRPYAEQLLLPEMPKRSFAIATAITDSGKGGMAVLIEHSDGVNESRYASAVDIIEETGGDWKTFAAGRDLGESGPNYLAADGQRLTAGVNTAKGSFLIRPTEDSLRPAVTDSADRILSLVPGYAGVTALTKDDSGRKSWSSVTSAGQLNRGSEVKIGSDEIVGAAVVAGTKDEVVLLGRGSSVIENIPALISRAKGGDRYVM